MEKLIPSIVFDRLKYDSESGVFTWIYKNKTHPDLYGKQAGSLRDGYVIIKLNGEAFRAHRIAWFMHFNEQPNLIDHINGIKNDNRICNLRNVSANENAKNHGRKLNGSLLPCGVRMLNSGKFSARITVNKQVHYLGSYDSPELAHDIYKAKRNELFGDYERK